LNIPINIISESVYDKEIGGPKKVVESTIKGLTIIGYPFVLNKRIKDYQYNWIHDSLKGLIEVSLLGIPAIIGPNIAVLPKDLPKLRPLLRDCLYLHPSPWCVNVWKELGFSECKLEYWPAGIDWQKFHKPTRLSSNNEVLIYFKERNPALLDQVIKIVQIKGFVPKVVLYRYYNESDYIEILNKSMFGIWLGRQESQGIALQEALASDLPLIVIDATSFFDTFGASTYAFPKSLQKFKTTSAAYFSEECGIKIDNIDDLDSAIDILTSNLNNYHPLNYIKNNLSLEKQANELISLFEKVKKKESQPVQNTGKEKSVYQLKITLALKLFYSIHVLRRKSKTFLRLLKNKIAFNIKIA
jgi:hypothetical protein